MLPELARLIGAATALYRGRRDPLVAPWSDRGHTLTDLNQAICAAIRTITGRDAAGWFHPAQKIIDRCVAVQRKRLAVCDKNIPLRCPTAGLLPTQGKREWGPPGDLDHLGKAAPAFSASRKRSDYSIILDRYLVLRSFLC